MINTFLGIKLYLITIFDLVQYLRHADEPAIQKQMLIAMSGILNFSEDEKKTIGLVSNDDDISNIGAKFIDYLLEEQ